MRAVVSFLTGGLFGLGLLISGMTDTTKVQGWLDVFGDWDPTLAFVMGGAIIPMAIAWRFTIGRKPVLAAAFPAPPEPETFVALPPPPEPPFLPSLNGSVDDPAPPPPVESMDAN